MTHTRFAAALAVALTAGTALAQNPPEGVPDVPTGEGRIEGRVAFEGEVERTAGLTVLLYALRPSGVPGLRRTQTDASGGFRFDGISAAPETRYLVGTQFEGIPFGTGLQFAPQQTTASVTLAVVEATRSTASLEREAVELRLDWVGSQLAVEETHRFHNRGDRVVFWREGQRGESAPFATRLPADATDFSPGRGGFQEGLEKSGDRVTYWGPFYVGQQALTFRYRVPTAASGRVSLERPLATGVGQVRVLAPESAPPIAAPGLAPGPAVERDGQSYRVLETQSPGAVLAVSAEPPETRMDPTAVSVARIDLRLELDDVLLQVEQDVYVEVTGTRAVVGDGETPLVKIALPEGAEFRGVSTAAQRFGLVPEAGSLLFHGPLPPGRTPIGVAYRLPVADGRAAFRWDPGAEVPWLNVLLADTGVVLETTRLHRRRPFRSGTRNYLHYEGFYLAPEPLQLVVASLAGHAAPSFRTAAAVVLLAALGAAWFVAGPLRSRGETLADPDEDPVARERDAIYAAIRDLDHDHETGKISDSDHELLRRDLRGRAIALAQRERSSGAAEADAAPLDEERPPAACPDCGQHLEAGWRFCVGCGRPLESGAGAERTG
ncbi:MAG: zinc ribbon domain-containing protein [Proteobacteria bacterium]|nr:zinc ribbon domain-containing protein [Pseudomonadota bacterium]